MSINFEDEIEKILNEDVIIPDSVLEKKEIAFNKIRKNKKEKFKFSYKHKIVASIMAVIIIGGIAFGNTAIAAIKKCLFPNDYGVQKAVDNGYIQNIENNVMKDNSVEIKVNNVLRDSKRVVLSLNLKFDDKSLMKYFKCIKLDCSIKTGDGKEVPMDENYNFSLDRETGELVFNDILSILDGFGNENMVSAAKDFKNINSLNLEIRKIELYADVSAKMDPKTLPKLDNDTKKQLEEAGVKLYRVIEGTWKTNIKLDEKFKDIKPIVYKTSEKNDFINIVSAEMMPTGMDITFNFKNQTKPLSQETLNEIDNITLVDDKGVIYKPTERIVQTCNDDNKTNVTKTFSVTAFDKIGNLKMIIKDLNGKTHKVKLIKSSSR